MTGHRFLSGFLGSRSERDECVMSKVHKLVGHVDVLAGAAVTQPQLAYAALSRSLQHEWKFLLHIVPQCGQLLQELALSLFSHFLPAMFSVEVSAIERHLCALPLWLDGLGISDPVSLTSHLFTSSVRATKHLVISIVGFETFKSDSHFDHVSFNEQSHRQQLGVTFDEEFDQLLTLFDPMQ